MLMVCQHERGAEEPQASGELETATRDREKEEKGEEEGEEEGSEINGLSRDTLPSMKRVSQRPTRSSLGTRHPPPPHPHLTPSLPR
jgi:hypothetical protein